MEHSGTPGVKIVRPMPRSGITIARCRALVAPLRGSCWFPLATGGFAAIHPRLFELCRSAAMSYRDIQRRGVYVNVRAMRSDISGR